MEELDFRPSRLTATKVAVKHFIGNLLAASPCSLVATMSMSHGIVEEVSGFSGWRVIIMKKYQRGFGLCFRIEG